MAGADIRNPTEIYRDTFTENEWGEKFSRFSYRYFGGFFKKHPDWFSSITEKIKEARMSQSYDLYLSKVAMASLIVTLFTSIFVSTLLTMMFYLLSQTNPIRDILFSQGLTAPAVILAVLSILTFAVSFLTGYSIPGYRANRRGKDIEKLLPHSLSYMFALSQGGMNLVQIIERLADAEDAYGEVSVEMQAVRSNMVVFDRDLNTSLREASQNSPSTTFSAFISDLITFNESGANLTSFLKTKADDYMKEAERDQKSMIESLEVMGQVYVTAFVAGPLFLIVILMSMSFLGGGNVSMMAAVTYLLIPIGNLLFFVIISTMTPDTAKMKYKLENPSTATMDTEDMISEYGDLDDGVAQDILRKRKIEDKKKIIKDPIKEMVVSPYKSMFFTVPIALVTTLVLVVSGVGGFDVTKIGSLDTLVPMMEAHGKTITALYLLLPIYIIMVPMSVFYEVGAWKQRYMLRRLPDALTKLAETNDIGMTLTEGVKKTAQETSGKLGDEFNKVYRELDWYHDINGALISMANRVRVPIVSRTVKLITDSNYSTGDLSDVLEVASRDTEQRYRFMRQRVSDMRMFTVIILISSLIYLLIIGILDQQFLDLIRNLAQNTESTSMKTSTINLSSLPIELYKLMFFHSAIIQGFVTGMLGGYLNSNNIYCGLKYAFGLSLVSAVVLFLV